MGREEMIEDYDNVDFEIVQEWDEDAYLQYQEEVSLEKRILEEEENE